MQSNKTIIFFDIDYTLFDVDLFKKAGQQTYSLYNEVKKILANLNKIVKLGIFSEGEYAFQKTKLIKTNIHKYFNSKDIHIVKNKDLIIDEILHKYQHNKIYFVDDKLTILYKAKKINSSLFVVWVKRGIYADRQKPIKDFIPDAMINDLNELIPIIQSLR